MYGCLIRHIIMGGALSYVVDITFLGHSLKISIILYIFVERTQVCVIILADGRKHITAQCDTSINSRVFT